MPISFARYFFGLHFFESLLVKGNSRLVFVFLLWVLISKTNEYDMIACSVNKHVCYKALFLELNVLRIIKQNSLLLADPVFPVLLSYDVLSLNSPLKHRDIGLLQVEEFLLLHFGLFFL